jgi:hypothetical protein
MRRIRRAAAKFTVACAFAQVVLVRVLQRRIRRRDTASSPLKRIDRSER